MEIDEIVKKLKTAEQVVAIKTDTVYGLICNSYDEKACKKIYKIKNREDKKPLSIFVKNVEEVKKYVDSSVLSEKLRNLMNKYWPGALTIILKKKDNVFNDITCGFNTIGIRIPDDKDLLEILNKVDFPLAQTSCNVSGEPEYKSAKEIKDKLGDKIDLIVDGGEIKESIPSTVIEVKDHKIKVIRQGAILIDE